MKFSNSERSQSAKAWTEGYLLNGASSNSKEYLDREFADLIKNCSPEKQKLIYNVAKAIVDTDLEEE